jgi:hypothetical protein
VGQIRIRLILRIVWVHGVIHNEILVFYAGFACGITLDEMRRDETRSGDRVYLP